MAAVFQPKRLLAATDLSESNIAALRYARILADRFQTKLTVMYSDPIAYPVEVFGDVPTLVYASTPEHQARLQSEVETYVDPILQGVPYDVLVTFGAPAAAVARAAEDKKADLLVIGTHGHHGWRRALLGSVAEGVLHDAKCPVLTVSRHTPAHVPPAITRIVCPTNFSDVARESLHAAGALASAFQAQLVIVHVIEEHAAPADERRIRKEIGPELERFCTFREIVLRGGAAERILDCVEDLAADFLVIGAQRKRFRSETVIGTTTERLVRFATCPVLTVPRPVAHAAIGLDSEVNAATVSDASAPLLHHLVGGSPAVADAGGGAAVSDQLHREPARRGLF